MKRLREWAQRLKAEIVALWFCARHPRTPLAAKLLAFAVVAYAFSPIDLIPDFVPVLGYLDDVILVPIGIFLTLKLIPKDVLEECRAQAARWLEEKQPQPRSYVAAAAIVALWLVALWLIWLWLEPYFVRWLN